MLHQDVRTTGRQSKIIHTAIAGFVIMLLALALPAAAQNGPMYKVTVTNLTRGSTFTPILVASHLPVSARVSKAALAGVPGTKSLRPG